MLNLGIVGIKSVYGRYLQAHADNGEMHASNASRNEEETWFLFEVDGGSHKYALMNWSNGKFIAKVHISIPLLGAQFAFDCAPANATVVGDVEEWMLVSGKPYGIENAIAIRSVKDGTYLQTNGPGQDTNCGGEVSCASPSAPPMNNAMWSGWWVMESATTPQPGHDFWNTVGGFVLGVVNNISAADVAALLTALAA